LDPVKTVKTKTISIKQFSNKTVPTFFRYKFINFS
jgi:hypothetical protein